MAAPPPVSVYMPAYNVGRFVRQAAESILAQSFGDFEFIIIDDGSTDDTLAVLKDLAARDGRIRLVSRGNMGVAATANEAIALARGHFIARLDGDDVALPDRLEKQVAFLDAHPVCVAVGSNVLMMDEDALPLYVMPDVQFGHDKIDAGFWRAGWPIVQGASTFRRDALIAVGGYRAGLSLHEDHDLFLRLAEHGKLENLPDVLLWYRQRLGGLTFGESATSRSVIAGILREARKRRGLPDSAAEPLAGNGQTPSSNQMLSRCRKWAWMSLKARHVATARKYARKTVRLAPFSADSWKLMYCALRGR
jgi:glycosyltransferase involved in cell wall biosynthesis